MNNDTWELSQTLKEPEPVNNAGFGYGMDMNDSLLIISSIGVEYYSTTNSGEIHTFAITDTGWTYKWRTSPFREDSLDVFGSSIALDGNKLAVSSLGTTDSLNNDPNGRVFYFTYSESGWVLKDVEHGQLDNHHMKYGQSLDLEDDILVVGANKEVDFAPGQTQINWGNVYIYKMEKDSLRILDTLSYDNYTGGSEPYFGTEVAIDEGKIVVTTMQSYFRVGRVFLYERNGEQWDKVSDFTTELDSTRLAGSIDPLGTTLYFGTTMDFDEGIIVVGGHMRAYAQGGGSAYFFSNLPTLTSVKNTNKQNVVENYTLEQNYPNPFNPATNITFSIPETENVMLTVYNALGQRVATLLNNEMKAGKHNIKFNATNFSSGVYFYRIKAGHKIITKKMMLIK